MCMIKYFVWDTKQNLFTLGIFILKYHPKLGENLLSFDSIINHQVVYQISEAKEGRIYGSSVFLKRKKMMKPP